MTKASGPPASTSTTEKLLAANPAQDVLRAQRLPNQRRYTLQNQVAQRVPPGVIHRFEVINVDHQQREGP